MWTFLKKIFQRHTKTCDQCGCDINVKRDAAICLQGEEHGRSFEIYVCEPCAERLWLESLNDDMFEELDIAENRDNYSE